MILLYISGGYGYYAESKQDPRRLVFIRPKRIRSFEELRTMHTLGAAMYNKEGAFFVNEILDNSDSEDSDDALPDSTANFPESSSKISNSQASNRRSVPTATVSSPDQEDPSDISYSPLNLLTISMKAMYRCLMQILHQNLQMV